MSKPTNIPAQTTVAQQLVDAPAAPQHHLQNAGILYAKAAQCFEGLYMHAMQGKQTGAVVDNPQTAQQHLQNAAQLNAKAGMCFEQLYMDSLAQGQGQSRS